MWEEPSDLTRSALGSDLDDCQDSLVYMITRWGAHAPIGRRAQCAAGPSTAGRAVLSSPKREDFKSCPLLPHSDQRFAPFAALRLLR